MGTTTVRKKTKFQVRVRVLSQTGDWIWYRVRVVLSWEVRRRLRVINELKISVWVRIRAVFFFPWQFSVCPWNFLKKCSWICKKCPWQKNPIFSRENWRVARDKIATKMPVKNEKRQWQFQQVCPWQTKSARDKPLVFYPKCLDGAFTSRFS